MRTITVFITLFLVHNLILGQQDAYISKPFDFGHRITFQSTELYLVDNYLVRKPDHAF